MNVLVTGGAGFIGSNFIIEWLNLNDQKIINLDKLTYAGNLQNLDKINNHSNYIFVKGDIGDKNIIDHLLYTYKPIYIINFASENSEVRCAGSPR